MSVGGNAHVLHNVHTLQNVNSPDFDLDRDIISTEVDAETVLGIEAGELGSSRNDKFMVNISTILISAFIFLAILAWFDFIQTAFYLYVVPEAENDLIPPSAKLWYAILITIIVLAILILIYYYSQSYLN